MNPFMALAPKRKPLPPRKPVASHPEPDADEKGGKPDGDADDKGAMKLRFKGKFGSRR